MNPSKYIFSIKKIKFINNFIELQKHLPKKRKLQYLTIFLITVICAFFETIAVTSSVPFISFLTNGEGINVNRFIKDIFTLFNAFEYENQFMILGIIFGLSIISASILRLVILYLNIRFSELIGLDIGKKIYFRSLNQPYIFHTKRTSSELIDGISIKVDEAVSGINCFLQLVSWALIFTGLITSLFLINYRIAITSSFIFISIYFFIALFTSKRLLNNGKIIATKSKQLIEVIQDSFGGIRDIIIGKYQESYTKKYETIEKLRRKKIAESNFITLSPKFILEAIGYTLLIVFTLYLNYRYQSYLILSTLGGFAIGAQRLLPALQQIYANISKIKTFRASFEKVLDLLNQPVERNSIKNTSKLNFSKSIQLKNVSFTYGDDSKYILNSINIDIKKGECIGIKGQTGAGKSTLLDILMGLLKPTKGQFLIDGKNLYKRNDYIYEQWINNISHVPQSIFLTNSTIENNIAFGIDNKFIDYEKLNEILEICQLKTFISSLKYGYETIVGERGIMLSGGQRQRIGIARALYMGSEVIFLDEATSSLDNHTEKKIMDSIYKLGNKITIIIVAHRLSTLKSCDKIYELKNNELILTDGL